MKISIIIPTRNEELTIGPTIQALQNASSPAPHEIIVVDGASDDATADRAKTAGAHVISSAAGNRGRQLDEGARAAKGDILLFLHADTRLPANWEKELLDAFSQNTPPALTAFRLGFDQPSIYFSLLAFLADLRAKYLTGVPHGDQALAVLRKTYLASGGFPAVPLMEEYYLIRNLKPFGPLQFLTGRVKTSSRRYQKNGKFLNPLRNLFIITMFYLGVRPSRLAAFYR